MYPASRLLLFTLIVAIGCPTSVASAENKATNGPVINVTKHICFPDFSPYSSRINQDVTLLGRASISQVKKCIQIPTQENDLRHMAGRAIYSSPIRLLDPATQTPASFQTTFSFQFQTPLNASNYSSNHSTTTSSGQFSLDDTDTSTSTGGSGLTFIIVPDEFTVGRPGPWLGMLNDVCDDDYKVVAVEFDAHQNPEFGDPNDNHVGINLGSIVSATAVNASEVGVYLKDGSIHRAWIFYDGQKKHMAIHLGKDGENLPPKPLFSGPLDLSPFLKEYMFVGFSASTGNCTQIHNIMSWNFTSTSQASLRVPSAETCESKIISQEPPRPRSRSEPPSSFLIFLAAVILLLAVLINLCLSGRRKHKESDENNLVLPEKKQRPRPPNKPRRFTRAEISSATRGFSESQILGGDEKSVTYKAMVQNGGCNNAVVKRFLTRFFEVQGLDRRRVHKEIKAISKIRHPNLVPIRGWCFDNKEAVVVYDYIPNGSLDKWLYGVGVLPWTRRFKAVKDVAEALSYLHSNQLAHKNVKTSSVFLDVSFRAVVGDFGFVLPSFESTRFESIVSQTADVFNFGVFILEVVAGRGRGRGRANPGEMDLLEMAWALHEGGEKKVSLVERKMGSVVNPDQVNRVIEVGLLCSLNENRGRPRMEQVVEYLNLEKPIPELPPGRPVSLFPYSSTTGLCSGYTCAPFK
ncbi:hypothetical protein ACH5RR_017328 [Cinchona calisaya]|uniref:Protein kinase domain-containing protein n=1 Tax=Cinchona calisaya TaxID=153742 RepID=A0ABD2ZZP0_9GENT